MVPIHLDMDVVMKELKQVTKEEQLETGEFKIQSEAVRRVPESLSKKYNVVPLEVDQKTLILASATPVQSDVFDDLTAAAGCPLEFIYVSNEVLLRARSLAYGHKDELEKILESLEQGPLIDPTTATTVGEVEDIFSQGPVSRAIHIFIEQAVRQGASDIHMEPQEDHYRIRYRVDGLLKEVKLLKKSLQPAMTSSTKIMASLDIGEQRLPQDGRFQVDTMGRKIDLRVSSFPTLYGEKIVLRILDKEHGVVGIDKLGLAEHELLKIEKLIQRPHGIVLVTGPTGSGKSTTLYAVLKKVSNFTRNVVTLEDPIEYNLPGVNQAQINPKKGLTFATGLRSILRQDPDVIMVGEIRDRETAEIAIHASLTGHLVLSTLHTNDAPSAMTRLIDMGIEPFLAASSVEGVMAQRLLRRLCPSCKRQFNPPKDLLDRLGVNSEVVKGPFFEADGCPECAETGYRGRIAITELMLIDDQIREMIHRKASATELRQAAIKAGMHTLRDDALLKVQEGATSIEELLRILSEVAAYEEP